MSFDIWRGRINLDCGLDVILADCARSATRH
jgi:hypothetical protein